jgi:SNF2 family DNA or RNA helicase
MTRTLRAGVKAFPVQFEDYDAKHLKVTFGWRPGPEWSALKDEIKAMRGARFHKGDSGPYWTIEKCDRNNWTLDYLDIGRPNPYKPYDEALSELLVGTRRLYEHQCVMLTHAFLKKRVILAAEMGTGKTLVVIELLEKVNPRLAWYIAPKFALHAVAMEFNKWKAKVRPMFLSYDQLKKVVANWETGKAAPNFIVFDESAYLKTPTSQRSQYAQILADGMRQDHKDPYIILMSGAPAPKSPEDWWKQCEIACPGFVKEGHPGTFKNRLALIIQEASFAGGSYPKLITWYDDERKCKSCGALSNTPQHMEGFVGYHKFVPSINEVAKLYDRLKGLVLIQFKKDCLDLPDKIYREIAVPMSQATKRAMRTIIDTSPTTIEALTRLRELSDGFQYTMEQDDTKFVVCPRCKGTRIAKEYEPEREITCPNCDGEGVLGKEVRKATLCDCPKDEIVADLLEENEQYGRIVIYAGFTASVDRCVELCKKHKWSVLRVDGRGMWTSEPMSEPLMAFQDPQRAIDKLAFVAHPATAKTSLTLTASSMIIYYSNTFVGDDRIQSEDRIHRIGMDVNRGATIVDLIHLPTDKYVLDNLKNKKRLQGITLGEFKAGIKDYLEND